NRRELIVLLGGAMMAPRALHAQQKAMPVIGYLNSTSPDTNAPFAAAFRQGLSETGWVEGQNVAIEDRWAGGNYDLLPALASGLLGDRVDGIAPAFIARSALMPGGSSTVTSRPICRCSSRRHLSWSSISRPRKRSA